MHEAQIALGTYTASGGTVYISTDARRRHLYVIGKSGTGKTTLLHNLMLGDLNAGAGFCLIDPHGDEAEHIADSTPPERVEHTIYLDPASMAHSVAYNPLEGVEPDRRPLAAEQVLSAFAHVWGLSAAETPRLLHILRNALRLLLDTPGSTLLGLPALLIRDAYRVSLLRRCQDPTVRMFWEEEFMGYTDRLRADAISAIQNKAGAFVSNPAIRNILGQARGTLHPASVMDTGKVLICNLSKGRLGEETAGLLGALLTSGFAQAAQRRAEIPEERRRDFTLYIDEFQNFTTTSFATILAEARKYRLSLVMAHQFMSQVPEFLQDAVIGTANTLIAFRTGAKDAPLIASELGLDSPIALKDLPNYEAWVKTIENGVPGTAHRVRTAAPTGRTGALSAVRSRTRARHARPRAMIEQEIEWFLRPASTPRPRNATSTRNKAPSPNGTSPISSARLDR